MFREMVVQGAIFFNTIVQRAKPIVVVSILLLATACGFSKKGAATDTKSRPYKISVFYATDRQIVTGKCKRKKLFTKAPGLQYGADRNEPGLQYGISEVYIPHKRKTGQPQTSYFSINPGGSLEELIVLKNRPIVLKNTQMGFSVMADSIKHKYSDTSDAFIFIHGFNATFDKAAKTTALLAYDLQFTGAPIMFSWPSRGRLTSYIADEAAVAWATLHLQQFLEQVFATVKTRKIHIIAHSMGNRAITEVLLKLDSAKRQRIDQLILMAADVDADVFRRDIAPGLQGAAKRITMYCSSKDEALKACKIINHCQRVGQSRPGVITFKGIDTIDVSDVKTDISGHNYFIAPPVITDISRLFNYNASPYKRGLFPVATYWSFSK